MAATVSSPWGNKPGAWAQEAEEYDAELQQQKEQQPTVPAEKLADFPSLSAAAATKTKKKKQTLSLAEFSTYTPEKSRQPTRLTFNESLTLPTGPRERSADEDGRGFKSYGQGPNRYGSNGDDSSREVRWGSSRVSNRDSPRESSNREVMPSRADEIDDWAAAKKSSGNGNGFGGGFERRDRGGDRGGFFDSQSKADEADSWVSKKSTNTYAEAPKRFGSSFERGTSFERKNSFDSLQRDSPRDMENWGKKREESGGGSPSAGARPRLVLQPRSVPLSEEMKRESSPVAAKPKGSNPFGAARPREEVLAEKGQDWKEIDEKLEATKIKEVAEKGERGKGSFGPGSVRAPADGSWRRNEADAAAAAVAAAAEPQSEEITENGDDAAEN